MTKNHSKEGARRDMILTDSSFFIMVNDPNLTRRSVLEASKATLTAIKGIYGIGEIKAQKQQKLEILRSQVREIRLLLQKAEELMPKYSRIEANKRFPHLFEQKHEPKNNAKHKPVIISTPQKLVPEQLKQKLTEAEKIAQSMQEVEEKLSSLPEKKTERRVETRREIARHEAQKEEEKPKEEAPAPVKQTPKEPEVAADPRLSMEDMSFELGKTLEGIQRKLKNL